MNEKNDIDIISCATDTIAAGAIEAIHTYVGSQIPKNVEDTGSRFRYILENTAIQVTGFGDNQLLKAVTGGIPTVHFGLNQWYQGCRTLVGCDRTGRKYSDGDQTWISAC